MPLSGARSRLRGLPFGLALLVLLSSARCVSTAPVRQPAAKTDEASSASSEPVRVVAAGERTAGVGFRKILLKIPRDLVVGKVRTGKSCEESGPFVWKGSKDNGAADEFGELLLEELGGAGYTVVGDPDVLFDDPHGPRAEYVVAGIVRDVRTSVCFGTRRRRDAAAAATLSVEWQVYSHRNKSVALKETFRGESYLPGGVEDPGEEAIALAFVSAARQLAASPRFHDLVAGRGADRLTRWEESPVLVAYETAPPKKPATASVSVEKVVSDSRMSVVTLFAGNAMGSGFVISADGYVLTSQHVVGESRYVRARFVTGREVEGEVVRADPVRDVALLKLEDDIYKFLQLGESGRIRPGSDVFAIGTPLSEKLGQTVTKGILSGYGEEDGLRTLRSDVAVHQGSSGGPLLDRTGAVVALSVSGYMLMPDGVGVGLNSFIPIEDALSTLAIRREMNP